MNNEEIIKSYASKFIDSVISDDEDTQRESFKKYLEMKTKCLLNLNSEKNGVVNEYAQGIISDDIEVDGNNVLFKNKKIGEFFWESSDLMLKTVKGNNFKVKEDLSDLPKIIDHIIGNKL